MSILFNSVLATFLVSLISLIGIVGLLFKKELINKIILLLVGFSAGSLLGSAFFHFIPEIENPDLITVNLYILFGLCLFFLIERFLHWHHCHKQGGKCKVHTFSYMNLIGDGVHNYFDGMIIASSFSVNFALGISTTFAVISHEIPQEISDMGVLIHGGFSAKKALFYNFLSALISIFGAIFALFLLSKFENFEQFLLPIAAGGFIYIAASDLIPQLHKEANLKKSIISFLSFIIGIIFMLLIKIYLEV